MSIRRVLPWVLASVLSSAVAVLIAGPLTPAGGAPASTYKTLSEVEPRIAINATNTPGDATSTFRITQPGSYYLTGNIAGEPGKVGISIGASNVTLDLNGFTIANTGGAAIARSSALARIVVRNGTVTGSGNSGILLNTVADARVERVAAISNIGVGIFVGDRALVESCVAQGNSGGGIIAGDSAILTDCLAVNNTSPGIGVASGFSVGDNAIITRCTTTNHEFIGLEAGNNALITDCTARANNRGIDVGDTSQIRGCNAIASTTTGITAGVSASIIECNASSNGTTGISVANSSTVRGCTVNSNTGSGIQASAATVIQNNMVSSNAPGAIGAGQAGILCTADDNRVEGNTVISNAQDGIRLNAAGNLVVRNTLARGGTTINAVANNRIAQTIINPAAGFVSTDPNANIVY